MALRKKDLMDMYEYYSMSLDKNVAKQILPVTGRSNQSAARDYIQAICLMVEYNKANPQYNGDLSHIQTKDDLWNGLHPATKFRLKSYTPCLAARFDELKDAEKKNLFENKSVTFTEKINGCFAYNTPIVLADGTTMPIGEIVRRKLPVEVLSYNETTGKVEPKRVVNWFNNGKKSNWRSLSDRTGRRNSIHVTSNHKFYSNGEYTELEDVDKTKLTHLSKRSPLLYSLVLGTLLGDSCLYVDSIKPRLTIMQCEEQSAYFKYKKNLLSEAGLQWGKEGITVSGFGTNIKRCASKVSCDLIELYKKFYDSNSERSSKKRVTREILEHLTLDGLALWYMDDGSLQSGSCEEGFEYVTNKHCRANFATQGFSYEECEIIKSYFDDHGYTCKLHKFSGKTVESAGVFLTTEGSDKFFRDICSYIPECMQYKLPKKYRNAFIERHYDNHDFVLDFQYTAPNYKVMHRELTAYDIEVEDNHNYFAGGYLVHNCRSWVILYKGDCHIYSRNYSDKDCGLIEYAKNIYQSPNCPDSIFAVDCEIVFEPGCDIRGDLANLGLETDSQLEAMVALLHTHPEDAIAIQKKFKDMYNRDLITFRLIAPLYVEGKNYLRRTLGEGQDIYDHTIELGQKYGLNLKPIKRCNGDRAEKELFLNTLLEQGSEGVVCHFRNGAYNTSENRSKTSFVKIKRTVSSSVGGAGLDDTIDAFVTGFKMGNNDTANEGIIGALEFSIHVNDNGRMYQHPIAMVPSLPREERILATWNNGDGLYPTTWKDSNGEEHLVSLNPDFDGLVAELSGQALSARSRRLEHPRLIIWRPERMPDSCIYTSEWLKSQTTDSVHNEGGIKYSRESE